jgi:acetyl-CoA synthetase
MPKATRATEPIQALLKEGRKFPPTKSFVKAARVKSARIYAEARRNPLRFWERQAKELCWIRPWRKTLDWRLPCAKWFVGGKLNVSDNCLDRHVEGARRNKAAIVWEGEPRDSRVLTYGPGTGTGSFGSKPGAPEPRGSPRLDGPAHQLSVGCQ